MASDGPIKKYQPLQPSKRYGAQWQVPVWKWHTSRGEHLGVHDLSKKSTLIRYQ